MSNASPALSSSRTALASRAAITAIFLLSFVHFWIQTTPARFGSTDDVLSQALVDQATGKAHLTGMAIEQGRFNFATPGFQFVTLAPYSIRQPWLFSLIRTSALYSLVGLLALLLHRLWDNAAAAGAFAVLVLGTLHCPLTFFPVLSYPNFWVGGLAVAGALVSHQAYLKNPHRWSGCMTAALFLIACLLQDFFVIFLPLFVALAWGRGFSAGKQVRANLGPLAAAGAFLLVYLVFARLHPSAYAGTQPAFDWPAVVGVILRQLLGIIPGFELLVNRPPAMTEAPLLRPLGDVLATLRGSTAAGVVLAAAQVAAFCGLLAQAVQRESGAARRWVWIAAGFALLVNLPVAFSAKYQVFIFHREYPYLYAFYSFLFLGIALVGAAVSCAPFFSRHRAWRLGLVATAGLLVALACLSAEASNQRVVGILSETLK